MKSMKPGITGGLLGMALFLFGLNPSLHAQVIFKCLHSFSAQSANSPYTNSDGSFPIAGLIQSDGMLYGTTQQGGSSGNGAVFAVSTDGTVFTNLHSFATNDGSYVVAGVVLGGTNLYGAAGFDGSADEGTIYSVDTNGVAFSVLHNFSETVYSGPLNTYTNYDGANPESAPVYSGNMLYGTTTGGGSGGNGTIFAINLSTMLMTNLYVFSPSPNFVNNDGSNPNGLTLSGSMLYGTATGGGKNGYGCVFAVSTNGTGFTNLYNFSNLTGSGPDTNTDGAYPAGSLVLSGNLLYGMCQSGGSGGFGSVFAISTNGGYFTNLYSFAPGNGNGYQPARSLTLSGDTLFGATQYGDNEVGGIFSIKTNGTGYKNVYEFTLPTHGTNSDGGYARSGVLLLGNVLYGVATDFGPIGYGTVYSISMIPPLKISSADNQTVVSWPPWGSGFTLQTMTNLSSGAWSNITSGIVISSSGCDYTNTPIGKSAFFRLKSQ